MTDDIVQLSGAEGSVLTRGVSRRAILQLAGFLGAGVALGPTLAACAGPQGGGSTAPSGAAGGAISIMLNRNLVSLDNKLNQYDAAVTVQRAVRQALTRIGLDLKPELVLAKSFELTSPTVWTVKLRDDIHYSDKSPVTVEDVETALKLYFQVSAGYVASQFSEQPKLAKTGERSFTLTTVKPVVTLDALMSNILITPAAANKAEELREGIGSGPFTVAAADSGTGTYKLVRNENYWGEKALLAEVNVAYQEDEGARVIAITSGQTDVIDTITPESAASLKTKQDIEVVQTTGTRLIHLFYNFRKPSSHPLSKPAVREALSYAIDHESLITSLMAGQVTSATGVVPSTLSGYAQTGEYKFDAGQGEVDAGQRRRRQPEADVHLGGLGVRRRRPGAWRRSARCSTRSVSKPSSSRSPRVGTSTPGGAGKPATGTCWPTATATRPVWPSPT